MKLMDDALMDLYSAGTISQEECYARAEQKALMRQQFRK
jgi:Tfp pilus assembly ATPase PilU